MRLSICGSNRSVIVVDSRTFCRKIEAQGLSVRATEDLVNEAIRQADVEPRAILTLESPSGKSRAIRKRTKSQQVASLEQELRNALGLRVDLKSGPNGRGKIVIHFGGHEDFERLRSQLSAASTHSYSRTG